MALYSECSKLLFAVPHRRYYEERTRLPDCFSSASRTCYEPVINEYGDDPLETLRSTDLREICAYVHLAQQIAFFHIAGGSR